MPDELTMPIGPRPGPQLLSRKIRIEVVDGPDRGLCAELPGPDARIGFGKDCDVALKDPTVSRLHIVVRVEQDRIRVIDAGSRNGTKVDGVDVRDAYARPDSAIQIGATTLRFRMLADLIELPLSDRDHFGRLIGKSVAMRRIFAMLERIARADDTVLIEGENGTGKELVAEAIHTESPRASKPFVVFDGSAVGATLIESELFGHVRGAFTGAVADRQGLFEAAAGGTLFLDEIGELPLELQPKLLRVLERREVRRMGSNVPRRVDVRIVAATNRTLTREVDEKRFREDLYHRLAVLRITVPPLRERLEDVALLVRHFEQDLRRGSGSSQPLPDEWVAAMAVRSWPGNVRELRNVVARALALGIGTPAAAAAPAETPSPATENPAAAVLTPVPAATIDLNEPLLVGRSRVADAYERAYIHAALEKTGGNVSRAAELARVNRKFIQRAMRAGPLRADDGADDTSD